MILRKNRLDLNIPAELAIFNAMQEVEKVGADVRLTEVVSLLSKAKEILGNYVDSLEEQKILTIDEFYIEYFKGEREYDRNSHTMAVAFAKYHMQKKEEAILKKCTKVKDQILAYIDPDDIKNSHPIGDIK